MRLPLLWPAFVALAAGLLAPAPHRHAPAMRARPAFRTYSPLRMAEGGAREEVLDETEELDDASPSGLVPSGAPRACLVGRFCLQIGRFGVGAGKRGVHPQTSVRRLGPVLLCSIL